ncbi:hypothetical protein ABEF92_000516 [Exophiala dermatitidis]|uniref:Arginine metabolism regulation protein II n=1 Tax=Exophiala dermatitidis (strain ATCC 34100 / CBS 525.76 / NIH/UT8656) TaxID=858893 RepID=H6BZ26_EXODN|nr:arginine metabolism regulation protein II [Exophiala dermatitidis NIH/UT8656]EHY56889.1 arginine metabolism regulation protein II [Exophiala dermatitidis NIH/UT8656]
MRARTQARSSPDSTTSKQRNSKRRTKTFTGCWTCRERRVKCDEKRPVCHRCTRSGVRCRGYAAHFTWINWDAPNERVMADPGQRGERLSKERHVGVMVYPPSCDLHINLQRVEEYLIDLDQTPNSPCSRTQGPFSVFPARNPGTTDGFGSDASQPNFCTGYNDDESAGQSSTTPATLDDREVFSPSLASIVFQGQTGYLGADGTLPEPTKCWSRGSRSMSISGLGVATGTLKETDELASEAPTWSVADSRREIRVFDDRFDYMARGLSVSDESPDFAASPFQEVLPCSHQTQGLEANAPERTSSMVRHIDLLQAPAYQRKLIYHWVTYLSGNMIAVDRVNNPLRTRWMAMALDGLNCDKAQSNGSVALYHVVCSLSSQNLSMLHGGGHDRDHDDQWTWLSRQHDQHASHHMQTCLAKLDGSLKGDPALALAILTSAIKSTVSGCPGQWRVHLAGGLKYLSLLDPGLDRTILDDSIIQSYLFLAACSNMQVPHQTISFLNALPDQSYCLDVDLGIPKTLLKMLLTINALGSSGRRPSRRQIDLLELELSLSVPALLAADTLDPGSCRRLQHAANVYYFALLIHFRRVVRQVPPSEVQDLVDHALQHLPKTESADERDMGIISAWPTLIIGAECRTPAQQRLMLAWFHRQQRKGFANLGSVSRIVSKVWRECALSACGSAVSWQDIVERYEDLDVILV